MKRTALARKTALRVTTSLPTGNSFTAPPRRMKRKGSASTRRDRETRLDQWGNSWTGLEYLDAVRLESCVICCARPTEAHHPIHDRFSSGKCSHFDAIPLCHRHHNGGEYGVAIHAGKEGWREQFGPDHARIVGVYWKIMGVPA